jgi:hypothetical protein
MLNALNRKLPSGGVVHIRDAQHRSLPKQRRNLIAEMAETMTGFLFSQKHRH